MDAASSGEVVELSYMLVDPRNTAHHAAVYFIHLLYLTLYPQFICKESWAAMNWYKPDSLGQRGPADWDVATVQWAFAILTGPKNFTDSTGVVGPWQRFCHEINWSFVLGAICVNAKAATVAMDQNDRDRKPVTSCGPCKLDVYTLLTFLGFDREQGEIPKSAILRLRTRPSTAPVPDRYIDIPASFLIKLFSFDLWINDIDIPSSNPMKTLIATRKTYEAWIKDVEKNPLPKHLKDQKPMSHWENKCNDLRRELFDIPNNVFIIDTDALFGDIKSAAFTQ